MTEIVDWDLKVQLEQTIQVILDLCTIMCFNFFSTVWIQIRTNILLDLVRVQTVCVSDKSADKQKCLKAFLKTLSDYCPVLSSLEP